MNNFFISVCKKWQILIEQSWKSLRRLDFSRETWGLSEKKYKSLINSIGSVSFCKIISRFGKYLTTVSMSMLIFSKICQFCPEIQELRLINISSGNGLKSTLTWLLIHRNNITKLHFELSFLNFRKKYIRILFSALKQSFNNLKSIHVSFIATKNIPTTFLLYLPLEQIEEISLEGPVDLSGKLAPLVSIFYCH